MTETAIYEQKQESIRSWDFEAPFSKREMIDELSKLILGNISEWELSKHSRRSALEIELLNSLEVHSCPFCQSSDIAKDGKKLRGISRNKLCIVTATDGNRTFIAYIGNGKPSAKRLIVDDGEKSHASLCRKLNSERESHPGSTTKGLPDGRNPLDPVNEVHRFFKRFMRNHGGYKRDEIQDWCNLFSFIWNHHGKLPEMVYDVMQLVLKYKKILRYRELFLTKSHRKTDFPSPMCKSGFLFLNLYGLKLNCAL